MATDATAMQNSVPWIRHQRYKALAPATRPVGKRIGVVIFTGAATLAAALSPYYLIGLVILGYWQHAAVLLEITSIGYIISGLGITICYHRLITHQSFETSLAMEAVMLICGSMAAQGNVVKWVVDHLIHHWFTEIKGMDPHTPEEGYWHAHWGWTITYPTPGLEEYAKQVKRDRVIRFMAHEWVFAICVVIPFVVGYFIAGIDGLVFLGLVRLGFLYHATWAVNAECHKRGERPYNTKDTSTNNKVVAVVGLGEGNHNNHHAFPWSARHGLEPSERDLSWWVICRLKNLHLVWNVQQPTNEQKAQMHEELEAAA